MVVGQNKTYVARLHVRSAARETLTLELRLKPALALLDLHPAGLPPSAVVLIRKVHDPAPGSLRLQDGAGVPTAWAQAVAASVDQIARRAARPALEPVSPDANAVLFADRAELLTCLAADWCDGTAITRWWWKTVFRATEVSSAVVREWLTSIEYAPAAFTRLAQQKTATTFASRLPPSAVNTLIDELVGHFGLTELRDARSCWIHKTQPRESTPPTDTKASSRDSGREVLSSSESLEFRTHWVPEAFSPRLDEDSRVLLAVALMLERAPVRLREHGFAARLLGSIKVLNISEAAESPNAGLRSQEQVGQLADLAAGVDENRQRRSVTSPVTGDESHPNKPGGVPVPKLSDYRGRPDNLDTSGERSPEPGSARVASRVRKNLSPDSRDESMLIESAPATAEHREAYPLQASDILQAEGREARLEFALETKFGGIFYLINAALALNLYGDFTTPLEPGIELSIWDFLALTSREIAGSRIEFDPVWVLLARLAGRNETEQPGSCFEPPDEWRMPPHWLNAFPEHQELSYQIRCGRLVVRHPAGFTVLDVELGTRAQPSDIEKRLAGETACYPTIKGIKRARGISGTPRLRDRHRGLERWIGWITDYLRVRLARGLGIAPVVDLATVFLARGARVEVTPARLDVSLSLRELPVEIRLAGLDRDPGWVPAAGRAIAFHYD